MPRRVADGTAAAYAALPAGLRDRTAIVGESSIYATYVDVYSETLDLPRAYSLNRSYGYFDPPSEDLDAVLWVGTDPGPLRASFAGVRPVGTLGDAGNPDSTRLWLFTGRHEPWSAIWERERHLDVS